MEKLVEEKKTYEEHTKQLSSQEASKQKDRQKQADSIMSTTLEVLSRSDDLLAEEAWSDIDIDEALPQSATPRKSVSVITIDTSKLNNPLRTNSPQAIPLNNSQSVSTNVQSESSMFINKRKQKKESASDVVKELLKDDDHDKLLDAKNETILITQKFVETLNREHEKHRNDLLKTQEKMFEAQERSSALQEYLVKTLQNLQDKLGK